MSARSTVLWRGSAGTVCSVFALATALLARPALAQQSYNLANNPTVASGSVTIDRGVTVPGTEVYTIGSATAVIDMVPADTATGGGVINFQNANTTALYTSTPGGPAYTVLNRIVPGDASRPIAFNGNVVSQLRNAAGAASRGGSVWFYSPGGIVVGDGAVFDVGNLLLSTGDPAGGGTTLGSTSTFNLTSTANGGGIVNILSGATINATNPGSYVALVAPIVFQRGTVNINGSAAYVAAEQASLTFNQGLFDINVTVGSSAANGFPLQHLGTTRFQNVTTPSRAYLVSVPKNDAITLVIGATADIGFDVATTVGVQNGLIVLGAGYRNVINTPNVATLDGLNNPAPVAADLRIDGGTFNAAVAGRARNQASLITTANTVFGSNVGLRGGTLAQAAASGTGTVLTIRGDLTLSASGDPIRSGAAQTGGTALLTALAGGTTQIGGAARLAAAGEEGIINIPGATGASTGGSARIVAQAGNISIGGTAQVAAPAFSASLATGGTAAVVTGAGFTTTVGGQLIVTANGLGLSETAAVGNASGGNARGGTATITTAGTLNVTGQVNVSATANGGNRLTAGAGSGGSATGGTATVTAQAGGSIAAGIIVVGAEATGGTTAGDGPGGAATAGTARLTAAGSVTAPSVFVQADATGGNRSAGAGATGAAVAGAATVEAIGAGVLTIAQEIGVVADAFGGRALGGTGSGADGGGGNARLTVSLGGRVVANAATIVAGGYGGNGDGAGGVGGAGTGGVVAITQTNGGSIGIVADARVAADGFGGAGAAAGGGRGGNANILANDGNLSVGTADVTAVGTGGNGDTGGGATGGTASILALNGQTRVAGAATVNAAAVGGTSNSGTGGAATGGTAQSGTNGTGAVVYGDAVSLQSIGLGGAGRDGGPGIGGTSVIYALRGSVTAAGPVVMTASGTGGTSIGIGTAGRGTGGLAYITADAGTVGLAGDADIDATGFGGVAATTSGNAGAAVGGRTQISVFANGQGGGGSIAIGGTTTIQSGALASPIQITATGNGGSATGGSTEIFANSGNITFNALVADAGAMSSTGADATATDAIGGAIFLNANGADIVAGTVSLNADASSFLGNTSTPRDGGSATGGRISVTAAAGRRVAVAQTLFASAVGRGGQTLDGGDRIAGAGTGGSIGISAVGTITAASIIGQADGFGGGPTSVIVSSGSNIGGLGTGGTVDISAVTGGVIGAGDISASAVGQGGIGGEIGGGGDALGGSATLGAYSGGSVAVTGATLIDAQAFGGQGSLSGVGAGGRGDGGGSQAASGGGAFLLASGGNVVLGSGQTWLRASSSGGPGYGGASGGVGTGGVAEVRAANGTIDARAGSLRVSSNGIGGDGVSGGSAGGAGFGGGSYVTGATSTAAAGQVGRVLLGNVNFASTGTGGAGAAGAPGQAGGDGGAGTGGLINLLAQAGNGVVIGTGAVSIQAGGFGGAGGAGGGAGGNGAAGRGGAGGVGTGGGGTTGTISLPATGFTTGSLTLNNLSAQAIGYGGLGGTAELPALGGAGGAGIGGNYVLLSRGAPVTLATASLQTMGIGGGSTSGVGGRGEGGEAAVEVTNRFQTSVRGALSVGQLSTFTSGQAGVLGAATLAGSSSILVRDGDARFGNVSISTAGDTPAALTNLNVSGGTLSARTLNIGAVGDIGLFTTATGLIDVGDATISTTGTLRFGDGTTGSNVPGEIEVVNLSASLGGDFIVDDDLAFGGDVILDIDGRIQTGAITSGGDTDLIGRNGIVTGDVRAGGGIFTSSDGDIRHGALASAKEVAVTGGGSVRTGAVTLTAYTGGTGPFGVEITARTGLTTGAVDSIEGIGLIARTGDLATGALTARTRDVVLLASGSVATGAVATATNGNVVVTNASQYRADPVTGDLDPALILASAPVRVGGAVTLGGDVTTGTFRSASSGATGAQGISAADTLFVDTGGGATLGAIAAGQAAYVGGTGAVSLTGAAVTRGRLTVDSAGNVAIGATQVGTEALLIARDARIDASAPITAGTSIALLADRGITTAALTGGRGDGAFVLLAGAGNRTRIGADGALPADFATGAAGAVSGAVAVGGAIGGGLIRSVVDGASRFDGAIDGARQVRLSSRGLAINGSVAAPSIELLSTDIALARGITVGGAATQSLALGTLSTAAPTTLGGAGGDATGGYVLDAAELAQLRSAAITFGQATTYGAGTQPLVVRDLTLSGTNAGQAANLTAANGAFAITAPGDIQLLGNVRLNAAGAGNALVFEAAGTFRLVTDTGSVGVFGTGDALAGRLAINARRIAAGDSQLVATVDPANVAAAIAAISAPAARTRAEGFLQAGRLELSASDSIVIQNSGTGALSGGFTAGSGGLRITGLQTGSGGTALIAYGRVQGEGGVFVTNAATRGAIIFAAGNGQGDPRAAFAAGSVVNGCSLIASVACGNTPAVQPTPPAREIAEITIGTDVQGVADGPLSLFPSLAQAGLDEGGVAAVPDVRLTTVIDASALKTDTIVNDPVGSGGNASLWEGGDADGGASGGDDGERRRTPSDGGNGR